jgi:hypothetical protein
MVGIHVIEPGAQREFNLRQAYAFAQEYAAVDMHFGFHCDNSGGDAEAGGKPARGAKDSTGTRGNAK